MPSRGENRRSETAALYVQIPRSEADKLDRAAFELKSPKRDLVAGLVARYVDPSSSVGLARLRALVSAGRDAIGAEIPQPPEPARRSSPPEPTITVSRASDWVAGLRRSIREFARANRCRAPFVRVTLEDGGQLALEAMTPGPGDDFATFSAYSAEDAPPRLVVVRLDAVSRIDVLARPPSDAEQAFLFRGTGMPIGFAGDS